MYPDKDKTLIVQTKNEVWVMPRDFLLFRLLVQRRRLRAAQLVFNSDRARQEFIHDVFLMSFEDEQHSRQRSPLASLGRCLLEQSSDPRKTYKTL